MLFPWVVSCLPPLRYKLLSYPKLVERLVKNSIFGTFQNFRSRPTGLLPKTYRSFNKRSDIAPHATTPAIFDWHWRIGPSDRLCSVPSKCRNLCYPYRYFSRTLPAAERSYLRIDRKRLAVIWTLQILRLNLAWKLFTVSNNHNSLHRLLNYLESSAPLIRWHLRLSESEFNTQYRKEVKNF